MDKKEPPADTTQKPKIQVRRQAVIVIHGIGEQRPMGTLRNLVATLVGERQMSRPDRSGGLWEIRRLRAVVPPLRDDDGDVVEVVETDFYELYWAHLVRDTHWQSVLYWIGNLCLQEVRPDHAQVARLRMLRRVMIGLVVAIVAVLLFAPEIMAYLNGLVTKAIVFSAGLPPLSHRIVRGLAWGVATGAPLLLVWWVARSFLVDIVGDAARYLSPEPDNVEARQKVIASGMKLLKELHRQKNIKRVVVVGHSLGSIIGYDLLSTFFADQSQDVIVDKRRLNKLLEAAQALIDADPRRRLDGVPREPAEPNGTWQTKAYVKALAAYRVEQDLCLQEFRRDGIERDVADGDRWLVSDFITCGSPLAYMDFLRRRTRADHERALARGDAASCPPEPLLDRDPRTLDSQGPGYTYKNHADNLFRLHQAALFALCRWTNLYYPGDIAGGPLRDLFGVGIDDRRLEPDIATEGKSLWSLRPGSHIRYWETDKHDAPLKASREALSQIIFGENWVPPLATTTARPVNLVYTRYADAPRDPWTTATAQQVVAAGEAANDIDDDGQKQVRT
jgi:hypothetical protein